MMPAASCPFFVPAHSTHGQLRTWDPYNEPSITFVCTTILWSGCYCYCQPSFTVEETEAQRGQVTHPRLKVGMWNLNPGVVESEFTFLLTLLCCLSKQNLSWFLRSQGKDSFTPSLHVWKPSYLEILLYNDTGLNPLFIQSILIKCQLCARQSPRCWEYRGEQNTQFSYPNYNWVGIHMIHKEAEEYII